MTRRPWLVAAVFAAAALVLAGALTWVTRLTLELERAEVAAVERSVHEENVRIALWRMDAALADFIARENARPGDGFAAAAESSQGGGAVAGAAGAAGTGTVTGGATSSPLVRARFELGADRSLHAEPRLPAPGWIAALDLPAPRALPPEPAVRIASAEPAPRPRQEPEARSALPIPSAPAVATPTARDPGEILAKTPGVVLERSGSVPLSQSSYTQEQLNAVSFEQRQELGSQASRVTAPPPPQRAAQAEPPPVLGGAGAPASGSALPPSQAATVPGGEEQAAPPTAGVAVDPEAVEVPATARSAAGEAEGERVEPAAAGARPPAGRRAGPTAAEEAGEAATEAPATGTAGGEVPAADLHAPAQATRTSAGESAGQVEPAPGPAAAPRPTAQPARASRPPPVVEVESAFAPRWLGDDLVLLRRAHRGEAGLLQGVWLEWDEMESWLLAQAGDLLPAGDLVPDAGAPDPGRSLALLPARLVPGPMPEVVPPDWTPVRLTLAAAWGAALLAMFGVAALLVGAVRLSQRRADFVSAVSHELRTPLTTFRLYAEMLRDGMVGEGDRRSYLETLSGEADRLEHLVGNVLAFSRLERRAGPAGAETRPLGELLAPALPRLRERAARGGLALEEAIPETLARTPVRADPAAVEQILTNLVDNACKYAGESRPPVLHLEAEARGRTLLLRVRDHGPGIAPRDRRRLFRPFHKSARHAAETAPGVGLGLALSRRMARRQGGRLRLARSAEGAAFELALRRAGEPRGPKP